MFLYTAMLSAFTLGGGYVMVPLMRERFSEKLGWIDEDELAELIALGQSSPGALVINSSVLMGYRLLGFRGALSTLLGASIPPILILSIVTLLYELIRDNGLVSAAFLGMRAGIAAVIADTVVNMTIPYIKHGSIPYIFIIAAAFIAGFFFDLNAGYIILSCGAIGVILGTVKRKRGKAV